MEEIQKTTNIKPEMSVLSQTNYILSASELFSSFLTPFQGFKYISIGLILHTAVVPSSYRF